MKFLILGASGFLGSNLGFYLQKYGHTVYGISRRDTPFFPNLRILDLQSIEGVIADTSPDYVINTIAMTSHEKCEKFPTMAETINSSYPQLWAQAASKAKIKFIQISTDAVYDGNSEKRYTEDESTSPKSVYGITKRKAEVLVANENNHYLLLRTKFFGWSPNQSKGILDFFANAFDAKRDIIGFTDYCVCSLYVGDLIDSMLKLVQKNKVGIYNVVSSDCLSKYDFGLLVAKYKCCDSITIRRGNMADVFLDSPRGKDLGLSTQKIHDELGFSMPSSEEGLSRAFKDRTAIMNYFKSV